jgi:lipid-binding SYLF domain-containing protein
MQKQANTSAMFTKKGAEEMKALIKRTAAVPLAALLLLLFTGWVNAQDEVADEITNQTILIDKAIVTLNDFTAEPNLDWFRKHIKDSYGIIIMPQLIKGGFIFGGSGGRAVLIARDDLTGEWSEPVFLINLGVSWGLQIGGKASEVIVLIRTLRGLEEFYTSSVNLGAEASIAAGPVGATGEAATVPTLDADYYSFAKSKGAFAGLSLSGSTMRVNDAWNSEYYGRDVRPIEIIVRRKVSNPKSQDLIKAVKRVEKVY